MGRLKAPHAERRQQPSHLPGVPQPPSTASCLPHPAAPTLLCVLSTPPASNPPTNAPPPNAPPTCALAQRALSVTSVATTWVTPAPGFVVTCAPNCSGGWGWQRGGRLSKWSSRATQACGMNQVSHKRPPRSNMEHDDDDALTPPHLGCQQPQDVGRGVGAVHGPDAAEEQGGACAGGVASHQHRSQACSAAACPVHS